MTTLDPYLKRKAEVLGERRRELDADSSNAVAQLKVSSYVAGITGIRPVKMGDYIVNTDSAAGLAGHSLGPSSPEMLLGALASCLAHTYVLQAALHDISLDHVAIEVQGSLNMAQAINPDNRKIIAIEDLGFRADIRSASDASVINDLHDRVDQACAVLNTIRSAQAVARYAA